MSSPSSTSSLDRLSREFGGPLPPGLAGLTEADATRLLEAIERTHIEQQRALARATENGLAFIPRLLRGPVRRVLFG